MKLIVLLLKKSEYLSSAAIRLVYLTGKAKQPIHPKHLIKKKIPWFGKYLDKRDKVLDIGCGVGVDTIKAAKLSKFAWGTDIDKKSLAIATNQAKYHRVQNVKFSQIDANKKFPFKNGSFDKVICSDVLEHLDKRNKAVNEVKRVLKKNGILLLVTDNPDTRWKKIQKKYGLPHYADPEHKYEYTKKEIIGFLKANGFIIISCTSITYDSPYKGLIDLTGGISLKLYKSLSKRKQMMLKKFPEDTTGYKIVAKKAR